jgi:hypothetical protein
VLWIRYIADPDSGSQTNADPDPAKALKSQKVEFLHEKILKVSNRSKNIGTYEDTKAFSKGRKARFIYENFVNFHVPGPGSAVSIRYGSGSRTAK